MSAEPPLTEEALAKKCNWWWREGFAQPSQQNTADMVGVLQSWKSSDIGQYLVAVTEGAVSLDRFCAERNTKETRCTEVWTRLRPDVESALHRHLRWPKRSLTREQAIRNLRGKADPTNVPLWPEKLSLPAWVTEGASAWQYAAIGKADAELDAQKADAIPFRIEGTHVTLLGRGHDVWEKNDHCRFLFDRFVGDFVLQARVRNHDRAGKIG